MLTQWIPDHQIQAIKELIDGTHKIVVLTHMSPDGDAMGSSLSMYHYLQAQNKEVSVIVPNSFPGFLQWMPGAEKVVVYDANTAMAEEKLQEAELIICTDFNEPKRIGQLGEKMLEQTCPKILIDHHLYPQDFAQVTISIPESPSASELCYRVLSQMGDLEACPACREIYTCIYTGMMTDTGNFSFNSNHPEMYDIIGEIVAYGINKDAIYNAVYNAYSADRMRLMGYCLYKKMRIFPEHHTALIFLNRKELYQFNFQGGDAEGIVNFPLQIKDVYYSCFMREDKDKIKISLRSQGDRPVNVLAHDLFNGGGHANASGGEFYGPIQDAAQRFIDNYANYFSKD